MNPPAVELARLKWRNAYKGTKSWRYRDYQRAVLEQLKVENESKLKTLAGRRAA